jgi:peptidyl-prolyl cis-trans isomerase SurA
LDLVRRAIAIGLLLALTSSVIAIAAPVKPAAKPAATTPAAAKPAARPAAKPAASRAAANDSRLDAIAAMVNDEAVLESDVEEELYVFLQQSQQKPDSAQVDTLRRQILDQLIDNKLIIDEAKRQAITVSDAEITRQVDKSVSDVKERLGGEVAFAAQLKKEGTSEAQLREKYRAELEKKMLGQKLVSKMVPQKPVAQPEAEKYFSEHKEKFPKVPSELKLSVIQVPVAPDSVALATAKAKAVAIRNRIAGGEKFAKVAAEVSDDPGSAKSGGDLGFFARGAMEPAIEAAAFALKLNEVSQPVRTPYGWHIVQTLERDTLKAVSGKDSLDAKGAPILEAHARHILVRVQPTEADIDRCQKQAERVRDEARKGTDFVTLVHRYSKYEGPADANGDVGFVSLANLQPNIRAGLDTLEVGQVSDVLTNAQGFNIFKVTDRHPERDYTLEEIKKDLPDAVSQVQFRERYDAWVKSLRAKANIEYRDL